MQHKFRGSIGIDSRNASLRFCFNPWAMKIQNYSDSHCHFQEGRKCDHTSNDPFDVQLFLFIWRTDSEHTIVLSHLKTYGHRFTTFHQYAKQTITTTILFALIFGSSDSLYCCLHFPECQLTNTDSWLRTEVHVVRQ
jgi:hypothetical protein